MYVHGMVDASVEDPIHIAIVSAVEENVCLSAPTYRSAPFQCNAHPFGTAHASIVIWSKGHVPVRNRRRKHCCKQGTCAIYDRNKT